MKIHFCRLFYLFLLSVLIFALASSCAKTIDRSETRSKPTAACRIVQHTLGEACIPLNPQRIIALGSGDILGNLLAIGIKPIAANSGWDAVEPFPKHLQDQLTHVEFVGSTTQPSLEKMLLLKPDLILANSQMEAFYNPLSRIAPTVIMQHPASWKQKLIDLGKVLNKENMTDPLMDHYWQRINELKKILAKQPDLIVSAVTMQENYGKGMIWAYGAKFPTGIVLNDIGVQRSSSQAGNFEYAGPFSVETLEAIDGNILFLVTWKKEIDEEAFAKLLQDPLWQRLKVVQNHQTYLVDAEHWYGDQSILGINAVIDDLYKYLANSS